MTNSVHRSVYRPVHTDESASVHRSYGRTDGRTDVDRWLSSRDNPRFRNARAHIRKFPLDPEPTDLSATRARADKETTNA